MTREPVSQCSHYCGQSRGLLPPLFPLVSSKLRPKCPGIPVSHNQSKRGKKNIHRASLDEDTGGSRERHGGSDEKPEEDLEPRSPLWYLRGWVLPSLVLLSLCSLEGQPRSMLTKSTQQVTGRHHCAQVCLLKGSLITHQDGFQFWQLSLERTELSTLDSG